MEDNEHSPPQVADRDGRRWARPVAFGVAGLLAGGLIAGSSSASADESGSSGTSGDGTASATGRDPSQPQRPDEHLLTGTKASKVRAAALEEFPGATVVRIETDSDGVYEAHLTTSDGQPVTVEVDADFNVTGTESPPGLPGGAGGSST